jgi:hypothetical protein
MFSNLFMQSVSLGYIGAFIVGFFFVSTYTVAPSGVVLFTLANELDPLVIALDRRC